MEEIFKQSFTYAKIKLFKNYSTLSNKLVVFDSDPISSGLPINGSIPNDDPFGELPEEPHPRKFIVSANANDKSCQSLYNLNLYKKNNRNYFFTTNPTDSFVNHAKRGTPTVHCDVVKLVNVKRITSEGYRPDFFETTKDGQIKRHYNNPFASIEINKVERWIQRDGDKIKVKLFRQTKTRKLGSKYYTRNTSSTTAIFDTIKGNFLIVTYQVHKKKKIKKFYSNSFLSLERAIPDIFNVKEQSLSGMSPLHPVFKGIFNNADFQEKLMFTMGLENNISDLKYEVMGRNFVKGLIPQFTKLKKIKVPNDSYRLIRLFYPTEKYLKKNDRKLVAAILDRFGILSKFTVKLLHEHPKMEFHGLLRLCHLFGKDYTKFLGSIDPSFHDRARENHLYGEEQSARHLLMDGVMMLPVGASNNEKENMVHIINDMCTTHDTPVSGVVSQFYDHFRMLERLRNYYPELGLNSRKWHTFTTEGLRFIQQHSNPTGLRIWQILMSIWMNIPQNFYVPVKIMLMRGHICTIVLRDILILDDQLLFR